MIKKGISTKHCNIDQALLKAAIDAQPFISIGQPHGHNIPQLWISTYAINGEKAILGLSDLKA